MARLSGGPIWEQYREILDTGRETGREGITFSKAMGGREWLGDRVT